MSVLVITVYENNGRYCAGYGRVKYVPEGCELIFSIEGNNGDMKKLEKQAINKAREQNIPFVQFLDAS